MEIVLKTKPDDFRFGTIEACERHSLQDIGTTYLQRHFNRHNTVPKDSPLYLKAVQLAVVKAFLASRKPFRTKIFVIESKPYNYLNLDRWRIIAASRAISNDIHFDEDTVNSYIENFGDGEHLLELPRALDKYE